MKFLHPGDAPEVEFTVPVSSVVTVRGYCNLHGLWKA
jgi:desulfoferrodoxin (superoxide reductase-like protein)